MAQYMAKWGNKGFLVSPTKIVPLLSLSTGFSRKADTGNDTSGTPTTNTRGLELQTISLETRYVAAAGVDPREQIEDWKKQFGKHYPLKLNGKQFGPNYLELDSVNVSEVVLDNKGRMIQADLSITLVEYVPPTTKKSVKNATSSSASSNEGAMNAQASTADKASKKVVTQRS